MTRDLALEEWVTLMVLPASSRPVRLFPDHCFPSDRHRDDYLNKVREREPSEVRTLIRNFLMPSCTLGGDIDRIGRFLKEDRDAALEIEQVQRALRGELPWEGITWVLDLLHRPRMAIDVIDGYLAAHFWWMPDWRIDGLFDAMRLIRTAYLHPIHPRDELLAIASRDFELVIGLLFERRGFEVKVTQKTRDGGYDVRLNREAAGSAESSVVECKRYRKTVGVKEVRALLGVVERDGATRGLLVTTGSFTHTARTEASQSNRIELVDYDALCVLFNENFGPDWPREIDVIVSNAQRVLERKSTLEADGTS